MIRSFKFQSVMAQTLFPPTYKQYTLQGYGQR